jgi:hypothetical protein
MTFSKRISLQGRRESHQMNRKNFAHSILRPNLRPKLRKTARLSSVGTGSSVRSCGRSRPAHRVKERAGATPGFCAAQPPKTPRFVRKLCLELPRVAPARPLTLDTERLVLASEYSAIPASSTMQ